MKKLDLGQFGEKKEQMFGLLMLFFRAAYPKHADGYENLRLCNRIGAILDAGSKEAPSVPKIPACAHCGRPEEPASVGHRVPARNVLLFPATEYAKLVAMTKTEGVIQWGIEGGANAEALQDALAACPEVEVEEKKAAEKKATKGHRR